MAIKRKLTGIEGFNKTMIPEILIFDPNTKTIYTLEELDGPYINGNALQWNLPLRGK